ncbi:MAG: YihY/virulence factor BrkB family protein [Geminicoccaceae bacterium]|nr:YihY/virulence factor BrkB family protein [Geminicoccaceae bacterium]
MTTQTDEGRRNEEGRGRRAETPRAIPKPGWYDIALRTKNEMSADHVSMVSAGVAFYGLLALFPAIAALVSIWGLVFDPQEVVRQIDQLRGILPEEAAAIVEDQATKVASGAGSAVSLAAIGGLALTLYSAAKGMKALIEGLNMIYDEEEKRGFFALNLTALLLTLGMLVVMIATLVMITVVPALLGHLGLGPMIETLVTWLRWPILFVVMILALAVLYRFAPSRAKPRWRWVSPGAVIATVLWVAGSMAFSFYVRSFGSYNETYGSIGAVVILLMWFWLSALIVLMGAELNSEIEHQTGHDTTTGSPEPMGERGAHAADTLGARQN